MPSSPRSCSRRGQLAALDRNLRLDMRSRFKLRSAKARAYTTHPGDHDQDEGDERSPTRICRDEQGQGPSSAISPATIYDRPQNALRHGCIGTTNC